MEVTSREPPVSEFIHRKFRNVHTVDIYGAHMALTDGIGRRHIAGGDGVQLGGEAHQCVNPVSMTAHPILDRGKSIRPLSHRYYHCTLLLYMGTSTEMA